MEILTNQDMRFDVIGCAVGTGGTLAGLIASAAKHQKVVGFQMVDDATIPDRIRTFVTRDNWELIRHPSHDGYASADKRQHMVVWNKYFTNSHWRNARNRWLQLSASSTVARTVIFSITLLILSSCGTKKVVYNGEVKRNVKKIENKSPKQSAKKLASLDANMRMKVYVMQYASLAQKEMKKFGIPASITLAQGLLESQAGVGKLALKSNNHFGIKCHKGWRGPSVSHDDDAKGECFRKYKKVAQSYRDHSEFLRYRERYSKLFKMKKTDYVSWAHGLKKAGYATDPQYAYKLISLIERYELWQFDGSEGPIKTKKYKKDKSKNVKGVTSQNYIVQPGDTLYAISKQFDISVQFLIDLNELKSTDLAVGQQLKVK